MRVDKNIFSSILMLPTLSLDFLCRLLITANSLDPNQARQDFGPDLNQNFVAL